LDRRLGGPQNRSERRGDAKNSYPYRDSNSDPSAVQLVASRNTDYEIPAPIIIIIIIIINLILIYLCGNLTVQRPIYRIKKEYKKIKHNKTKHKTMQLMQQ
jgi:hypothetical protein